MIKREALNVAGVCDQDDRFNCKYCRRAGHDCEGATSVHRRFPYPSTIGAAPRHSVREEAIEHPKDVRIEIDGKRVHVVEAWVFEYPDGRFETLKRRHLVTDPAQLKALSV